MGANTKGIKTSNTRKMEALMMGPLEAAAALGNGAMLMKFLESDDQRETLGLRAKKALNVATKMGKQETMDILNFWIGQQAALAAVAVIYS